MNTSGACSGDHLLSQIEGVRLLLYTSCIYKNRDHDRGCTEGIYGVIFGLWRLLLKFEPDIVTKDKEYDMYQSSACEQHLGV